MGQAGVPHGLGLVLGEPRFVAGGHGDGHSALAVTHVVDHPPRQRPARLVDLQQHPEEPRRLGPLDDHRLGQGEADRADALEIGVPGEVVGAGTGRLRRGPHHRPKAHRFARADHRIRGHADPRLVRQLGRVQARDAIGRDQQPPLAARARPGDVHHPALDRGGRALPDHRRADGRGPEFRGEEAAASEGQQIGQGHQAAHPAEPARRNGEGQAQERQHRAQPERRLDPDREIERAAAPEGRGAPEEPAVHLDVRFLGRPGLQLGKARSAREARAKRPRPGAAG